MTAEIVNLRRARKAKARTAKERAAAENRARFGRSASDKVREAGLARISEQRIEGAKREPHTGGIGDGQTIRRPDGPPQSEDEDT